MSNTPTDPDDWSGASEALFRSARQDHEPSTADRARVRQALARKLAEASNAPATDTLAETAVELARKGAARFSNLVKFGLGALVVALSVAAFLRVHQATVAEHENSQPTAAVTSSPVLERAPPPVPSSAGEVHQDPVERAAAPRAESEVLPRPTARVRERSPGTAAPARGRSRVAPSTSATSNGVLSANQATVAPESAAVHSETAASPVSGERAEPAPRAAQPASRADSTREPSERPAPAPAPEEGSAAARAELALLRRIQAGMTDADYAKVLSLCAEHARRWPEGTFVQEREGLKAIASCKSHTSDAAALARAFFRSYPRSPLAPRVREACTAPRKTAAP